MQTLTLFVAIMLITALAYTIGKKRSISLVANNGGIRSLNSLPYYYGMLVALWCGIPALLLMGAWMLFDDHIISSLIIAELPQHLLAQSDGGMSLLMSNIENIAAGNLVSDIDPALQQAADKLLRLREINHQAMTVVTISAAILGAIAAYMFVSAKFHARIRVEYIFKIMLLGCSCLAIFTTVGILLSVLFESIRFFQSVPISEFLFGLDWSPQMAIRADQVGSSGAFGSIPLFTGTLLISLIALLIAVPIGLMSAIYLSEYASYTFRNFAKPLLEILAGIPTVVYGFFAALTVAPLLRDSGAAFGISVSSESALAAGLVMGIMIIPFVSSLSDDVINAVPQALRDGSYGLGATKSETIRQVVIPAALPGIVGGVLLAASRAIGETMIVVMAAGMAANLTANPLESVTTVTVQIVTLLVGDQEFDSPKTLAAFALGLMLFLVTLALNFFALHVVRKYREQYE
jgi:phosphate transport system permease protein